MGFTYAYPMDLPVGGGGVSAVAITSKGDLWVFQRNAAGKPQLFEFDQNHKLIRTIGEDVIGHQKRRTAWQSTPRTISGSATRMATP